MSGVEEFLLIGAAFGSVIAAIVSGIFARRKNNVDADSVTIKNALALQEATVERLNAYDKKYEELQASYNKKFSAMEDELHDFERYINYLDSLLWKAGIDHMTLEQYRRGDADKNEPETPKE